MFLLLFACSSEAPVLFRNAVSRPFHVGDKVELDGLTVRVDALSEGTPSTLEFWMEQPSEWFWLTWREGSLREVVPHRRG
jgi:hypothetical protein